MWTIPCRAVAAALVVVALSSTGCVSSLKPLSDAKTSKLDTRLLGTWEMDDKENMKTHTIVVERKKDAPNVLQATATEDGKTETADLFTTKIGDSHYISVAGKEEKGVVRYVVAKYEVTDDKNLKYWGLDTEFFAKAIENHELKGTVKKEIFTDVTLDETPENLRKFLEKHGAKCFTKDTGITVKRIKKGN